MNGAKVLTFAMDVVPNNVNKLLKKIKIDKKNIHKFIFHQASKYILDNINRRLSIEKNKTFENYGKVYKLLTIILRRVAPRTGLEPVTH